MIVIKIILPKKDLKCLHHRLPTRRYYSHFTKEESKSEGDRLVVSISHKVKLECKFRLPSRACSWPAGSRASEWTLSWAGCLLKVLHTHSPLLHAFLLGAVIFFRGVPKGYWICFAQVWRAKCTLSVHLSPKPVTGWHRSTEVQLPCLDWDKLWGIITTPELPWGDQAEAEASPEITPMLSFSHFPVLLPTLSYWFLLGVFS